ncbi:MAG: homoserine kinase [Plectolyngbya sp. WJT66-NPBG17]|jgi:homoserine kinase|nr:homoserine kinase [Plectolyngbya sp. WJT66-NPBG17]MBW4528124.1 homoserine kinase [Phormidium tanganyikae FI6-MK23]
MSTVTVRVPATTANLGAGFDCLGAALTLYNEFQFSLVDSGLKITATGAEADRVSLGSSNLVYQAFVKFYDRIGQPLPAIQLDIKMDVPLARGLGSSATAIVGGLVGANQLAGSPLTQLEIAEFATEIEGHPDNVVPALIGGCRLAASGVDRAWEICDLSWHSSIVPIVAIPDFELSTAEARSVLPATYSRADAIFNTAHLGLLIRGLETGNADWLKAALHDRIHQPYRENLIKGYEMVRTAAIVSGAYGMVISGAGSTVLALAHQEKAESVNAAMEKAWMDLGVGVQVKNLAIESQGTSLIY